MHQTSRVNTQPVSQRLKRAIIWFAPAARSAGDDGVECVTVKRRPNQRPACESGDTAIRKDTNRPVIAGGIDGRNGAGEGLDVRVKRRDYGATDCFQVDIDVAGAKRRRDVCREMDLSAGRRVDVSLGIGRLPVDGNGHPSLAEFASDGHRRVSGTLDGHERPEQVKRVCHIRVISASTLEHRGATGYMAIRDLTALAPLVDHVHEIAIAELPAPRTLDMQCWDDGDFSVRVYHTHCDGRETVSYRQGEGSVVHRRVWTNKGVTREERVIADIDEADLIG